MEPNAGASRTLPWPFTLAGLVAVVSLVGLGMVVASKGEGPADPGPPTALGAPAMSGGLPPMANTLPGARPVAWVPRCYRRLRQGRMAALPPRYLLNPGYRAGPGYGGGGGGGWGWSAPPRHLGPAGPFRAGAQMNNGPFRAGAQMNNGPYPYRRHMLQRGAGLGPGRAARVW